MQLFRFLFTFCSLLYISPSHQKVKMYFVSFSQTFDNCKITNLCSWGKTREICLKAVDWVWVYLMYHLCPWFGLGTKKNKICAPLNTQPERLVVVLKDETSEISWNPHCHQMSSDSVLHNTQAMVPWTGSRLLRAWNLERDSHDDHMKGQNAEAYGTNKRKRQGTFEKPKSYWA